jgi:hypothetical protein
VNAAQFYLQPDSVVLGFSREFGCLVALFAYVRAFFPADVLRQRARTLDFTWWMHRRIARRANHFIFFNALLSHGAIFLLFWISFVCCVPFAVEGEVVLLVLGFCGQ